MWTHRAAAALTGAALFLAANAASADEPPALETERSPNADAVLTTAPPAQTATPPAAPPVVSDGPAIHHTPISSAPADEPLTIEVMVDSPHLLRGAGVVYRTGDKWFYVKLLRTETAYAATIPAEHMKAPGIGYAIEMEYLDGRRVAEFASRAALHPVVVIPDAAAERESALLARYDGRRSLVSATGEFVRFGYDVLPALPCGAKQSACTQGESYKPTVDDQYWRVEGSYTYRPLHVVEQFGFRVGVMRGTRPIYTNRPTEYTAKAYEVGVNYAGAEVRFRAASILHFDLSTLGSVTEVGFSFGAGAAVMLGDPLGTRFTFGWQTIGVTQETYFGTRFYVRLDLPVTRRFELGPSIEVTDMPHAESFGVRLLTDATIGLGKGFALGLRGGYQARVSRSGGPTVGATLQLGF
ncbi:MAG: hypothetical protein U0441_02210 [Polyangiaceae bacterium]